MSERRVRGGRGGSTFNLLSIGLREVRRSDLSACGIIASVMSALIFVYSVCSACPSNTNALSIS